MACKLHPPAHRCASVRGSEMRDSAPPRDPPHGGAPHQPLSRGRGNEGQGMPKHNALPPEPSPYRIKHRPATPGGHPWPGRIRHRKGTYRRRTEAGASPRSSDNSMQPHRHIAADAGLDPLGPSGRRTRISEGGRAARLGRHTMEPQGHPAGRASITASCSAWRGAVDPSTPSVKASQ